MNFLQEVKNYGTERANVLKNRAVNFKRTRRKISEARRCRREVWR